MKPIKFEDNCVMFAENQPEYETPPVLIVEDAMGKTYTSCWRLSLWERIKMLFVGRIYIGILGLQPPIVLSIDKQYEMHKPTTPRGGRKERIVKEGEKVEQGKAIRM